MKHFGKKVEVDGYEEKWKPILGYEKYYAVSNFGRVKSLRSDHILKPTIGKVGYKYVVFSVNGIRKTLKVHRLVATAFCPNPHNYPVVNHKNENKLDNNFQNLEWCTIKYNNNYGKIRERALNTRIANHQTVRILAIDLRSKKKYYFVTRASAARTLGIPTQSIRKCIRHKANRAKQYVFAEIKLGKEIDEVKLIKRGMKSLKRKRRVIAMKNGDKYHFDSLLACSKFLHTSSGNVYNALQGKTRHVRGYEIKEVLY